MNQAEMVARAAMWAYFLIDAIIATVFPFFSKQCILPSLPAEIIRCIFESFVGGRLRDPKLNQPNRPGFDDDDIIDDKFRALRSLLFVCRPSSELALEAIFSKSAWRAVEHHCRGELRHWQSHFV
jgi:hypothetical protein